MVNFRQQLFDGYEQLVAIHRQQLAIASGERYDQQIEDIRLLEAQKLNAKSTINAIRLEIDQYNEVISANSTEISAYINELNGMNTQLQYIINNWYNEASSEMKQVSVHRKTLQTYGGVNYSDIISYYIDDKK